MTEPRREEDRRVFFGEHLDQCRPCRDEMIDHATQLALKEIAEQGGVEVDAVVERLAETARQLRAFSSDNAVPFEEVVLGVLCGGIKLTTHSKPLRAASSAASTET